jgi:hypothetical protein
VFLVNIKDQIVVDSVVLEGSYICMCSILHRLEYRCWPHVLYFNASRIAVAVLMLKTSKSACKIKKTEALILGHVLEML